MSPAHHKRRRQEKALPPGDSTARVERRERIAAGKRRGARGGEGSWFSANRDVIRFVIVLGVGMGAFNLVFLLWLTQAEFFQTYLKVNAGASAAVLQAIGYDATAFGTSITSPRFSLSVSRGCDAIQVAALFIFAVLAWPVSVSRWRRAIGLVVGTLLLLTINLVRIVSLFYTGIYYPSAFETMHMDVWQPVFIVLALFFWVTWVWWTTPAKPERADVAV